MKIKKSLTGGNLQEGSLGGGGGGHICEDWSHLTHMIEKGKVSGLGAVGGEAMRPFTGHQQGICFLSLEGGGWEGHEYKD